VGIFNTLVGDGLMFALYNLAHWNYWISTATGCIFGSMLSFFLNKYFTFKVTNWSFTMVGGFIINNIVCYLIAYSVAQPLANYILRDSSQTVRGNVALLSGMCIYAGLNYLGQRLAVFRKTDE
jgi:putative flippase GtrA